MKHAIISLIASIMVVITSFVCVMVFIPHLLVYFNSLVIASAIIIGLITMFIYDLPSLKNGSEKDSKKNQK